MATEALSDLVDDVREHVSQLPSLSVDQTDVRPPGKSCLAENTKCL